MGWTTTRQSREEVTQRQMAFDTVSGNRVVAVDHHRINNEDWFLYNVRDASGALMEKRIGLTVWEGQSFNQLSEASDPYYFGCPTWWLDEVPAPPMVNAEFNWRQSVRHLATGQA